MNSMNTYVVRETFRAIDESIRAFTKMENEAAAKGDCSGRAIYASCVAGLQCARDLLLVYATADVSTDTKALASIIREDGGINE